MSESPSPELPSLAHLVDQLRHELKQYPMHIDHFIADSTLFGLAIDVVEQALAVQILVQSEVPRGGHSNARSAWEAAIDLLHLTASADDYDRLGCLARVHEIHEDARLRRRLLLEPSMNAAEVDKEVRNMAHDDASAWSEKSPGAGEALKRAVDEFLGRKGQGRKHWSGLTREDLTTHVAGALDPSGELSRLFRGIYGGSSSHSHPRMRSGQRTSVEGEDGTLSIEGRAVDREAPAELASYAVVAALQALKRRREFWDPA